MYEFVIDESAETGTLFLRGELSINYASQFKKNISDSFKKVSSILINHEGAYEFDLSYLQTLVSAYVYAVKSQKHFAVINNHPEKFISILKNSGCPEFEWMFGNLN